MNPPILSIAFPLLVASMTSVRAGEPGSSAKDAVITTPAAPSRWKFGVGYAPVFGFKVDFEGLGRFNSPNAAQPTGGGVDYDYDDGFVHLDSSGNQGDQTWNWSYENASQYDPANGGTISYTLTNSVANGSASEREDAETGIELFASYEMGEVNLGGTGGKEARWGFRGGFHYARLEASNHDRVLTSLSTLTDVFSLGGVIPPGAPYTGSPDGPGPMLGDNPGRTVVNDSAFVTGARELDLHLSTLRFGGYLELPLHPKVNLLLEAGVSATAASGDYHFASATSVAGLGTQNSAGSDSSTDVLAGVYVGIGASFPIHEAWSLEVSGRYQVLEDFDLGSNGSTATVSADSAFLISTAVVYAF